MQIKNIFNVNFKPPWLSHIKPLGIHEVNKDNDLDTCIVYRPSATFARQRLWFKHAIIHMFSLRMISILGMGISLTHRVLTK